MVRRNMKELLTARTAQLPREIVTPVDVLVPTPANPPELAEPHLDSKIPNQQDRPSHSQGDGQISGQQDKKTGVVWEKFGSQLKMGAQRKLKLAAIEDGREI